MESPKRVSLAFIKVHINLNTLYHLRLYTFLATQSKVDYQAKKVYNPKFNKNNN